MFDEYFVPRSIDEALEWLSADSRRRVLGGGTSVLPALRRRPDWRGGAWLDLSGLPELKSWSLVPSGAGLRSGGDQAGSPAGPELRLGAGLTLGELSRLEILRELAEPLRLAASLAAGPQIRNQATLAGNLLALGATDLSGPLLALGARLELAGPNGFREVELADFLAGLPIPPLCPPYGCGGFKDENCPPAAAPLPFSGRPYGAPSGAMLRRRHVDLKSASAGLWVKCPPHLQKQSGEAGGPPGPALSVFKAGEIISALILPPNSLHWEYRRYSARSALDFPCASIALGLAAAGGEIKKIRLALVGADRRARLAELTMKAAVGLEFKGLAKLTDIFKAELLGFVKRPCQEFRRHILTTMFERLMRLALEAESF